MASSTPMTRRATVSAAAVMAVLAVVVLPVNPDRPGWGAVAGADPGCTRTDHHDVSAASCAGEIGPPDVYKYVALGDSYSAGEGVEPYFEPSNGCHRSERAYPTLVEAPGSPTSSIHDRQQVGDQTVAWGFQACSGAVTDNVTSRAPLHRDPLWQLEVPRTGDTGNANDLPVDEATDLVTITIGGNDMGFAEILTFCAIRVDCTTAPYHGRSLTEHLRRRRAALAPRLDEVYARTHGQAPTARLLVLGYPQLFPASRAEQACGSLGPTARLGWSHAEQDFLRRAVTETNRLIARRVAASAIAEFVPVDGLFRGHEICGEAGAWINAVSLTLSPSPSIDDQSFHPNEAGHRRGYAAAVNDVLNPSPRPDGRIRKGASGPQVGDNIYNTVGAGQTRTGSARAGRSLTFRISIQNDGPTPDVLSLRGGGSARGVVIDYRDPTGENITNRITAGTYHTPRLAPGGTHLVLVTVTPRAAAPSGTALTRTLTSTSTTDPMRRDTVRFITNRT